MKPNSSALSIKQVAADLVTRKKAGENGATVILGAGASVSSGIPLWSELASRICDTHDITGEDESAIERVVKYFNQPGIPYAQRFAIFQEYLSNKSPSIGFSHLARLVQDKFVSTILTTNWDPLVEKALIRLIPIDQLKILVRGEVPDDTIAEILEWRRNQPIIVKLHGDVLARQFLLGSSETRRFSERLSKCLQSCVSECTFMVGQSAEDVDVLQLILGAVRHKGTLYYVRHSNSPSDVASLVQRSQAQVISGMHRSVVANEVSLNIGDFDGFFVQLDLSVQKALSDQRRQQLRKAERSILDKERIGVGYINNARITDMIERFVLLVKEASPDLVLFINDPSAPGGMELKRRMLPLMAEKLMNVKTSEIIIEGARGSRVHKRSVTSDVRTLPMANVQKILVLDAITFSGNTLRIAREAIKAEYPDVIVQLGVLVISNQLLEQQSELIDSHPDKLLWNNVTDRYEIFFPWGVTQTTSTFSRVFEGATQDSPRRVAIEKRPWGAIQILANEEHTSVRLLTIEAGNKLSFQRHLCRDELFVALDDNIGLEICAEDLPRETSKYDERVKSLVLEKDDYVLIPRGVWHRTKASMDRVRLLEVAFGLYDQQNDIERRWDDYQREYGDGKT